MISNHNLINIYFFIVLNNIVKKQFVITFELIDIRSKVETTLLKQFVITFELTDIRSKVEINISYKRMILKQK